MMSHSRRSRDVQIFHAATGRAGLAPCQRYCFDCVVLDIDLPDVSGFEVLANLVPRVHQPETVVIVLTRLANQYLLGAALKNGAQAAFYRPMATRDTLDKAILKAISRVPKDRKSMSN